MKKYLKLTLFKKIFLVVFCAFLAVGSFGFYLDYQVQLEQTAQEFIGMVDVSFMEKEAHRLIENQAWNQSGFQLSYKGISSNYIALLVDNQIKESSYLEHAEDLLAEDPLYVITTETETYDITELGEKMLEDIQDYILDVYRKREDIQFQIEKVNNKIEYFKMGNIEYNPSGKKPKNVQTRYISSYSTPEFDYSKDFERVYPKVTIFEPKSDNTKMDKMIRNQRDEFGYLESLGEIDIQYIYDEVGLYIIGMFRDSVHDFELVNVHYTGITKEDVANKIFELKGYVYISAFITVILVSLLISYMLTRRIKKIEKTTGLIADNQFDLTLKEKPKDELGDLSHSINIMSQKLKHTMEQLNQEIERVKQLESLRKEFINQFTHEMKTPLGIINGYSELLDEAQSDEEKEKYIHLINKETEKINKLIKSMLDLSRLEANKVELQLEDIDLEDIVTEIVDEYEVLLMKKEAKVNVSAFKTHIQADKELIKTVIQNFMSNAVKHVHEKGHINICIDEGVKVYNEGEHIPDENLDTIWYTFVSHDQQGSGLGLAICQSILELHGFEYGVMNKDDGVEFYFKRR